MDDVKRYQGISDKLISESYPILKRRNIKIFELKFTGLYGVYLPFIDRIGINKFCSSFSEREIKGLIAHELCHAELLRRYGFFKSLLTTLLYWFVPYVRKKEEDRTDMLTINKGYARDLALMHKRLEKQYPESKDKTYMSVNRIKSYAKSIGKW